MKLPKTELNATSDNTQDQTQVESFLRADDIEEKTKKETKSNRNTSGLIQSIRNSASYLEGNKYGEGRRVGEFGDDSADFNNISSLKTR